MKQLKLRPRTKVSQEFMEVYQDLARRKLEQIEVKIRHMSDESKKNYVKHNGGMISRLNNIQKGVSDAGIGLDFELSRLRSLEYEYLNVFHPNGGLPLFLRGLVRSPIMEIVNGNSRSGTLDSGRYFVYVNVSRLMLADAHALHFVPERAPSEKYRHPHHYAVGREGEHPLSWETSTCWSQFGTVITMTMNQLDLVELFRMGQVFANRYYPGSPLVGLHNLPFIKEVEK